MKMLKKIIPMLSWISEYKRHYLKGDLTAGLTVAVLIVPQAMAYAMLAGLPPVTGLYASTFPIILYAFFGTSRQLAVGPVAIVSLITLSGLSRTTPIGTGEYIVSVLTLTLLAGIIQYILGLLKMGFIINFLSHNVICGFTSAAAIIIAVSQLKYIFGFTIEGSYSFTATVFEIIRKIPGTQLPILLLGLGSLVFLFLLKQINPQIPGPVILIIFSSLIVFLFRLDKTGVQIIKDVPAGLPAFSLPSFELKKITSLLPTAFTIVFVGFMESIAISQSIAAKEKYKINASQELIGLGFANIAAAFFSGYPVTGGFSRTAVNYQNGAKTGLASIITAIIIIFVLLFFTPLFYYLPKASLAAIIILAVASLVDVKRPRILFKLKPIEGWTLIATFCATLVLGIEQGILLGIGFSLAVFLWRSSRPHIAVLGYVKEKDEYLNIKRFSRAETSPTSLILRIDASLFFANTRFIETSLRSFIVDKPDVKYVIFDLSGVNDIDAESLKLLEDLFLFYKEQNIHFIFFFFKGPVRDCFKKADWEKKYILKIEYNSLKHALAEINQDLH